MEKKITAHAETEYELWEFPSFHQLTKEQHIIDEMKNDECSQDADLSLEPDNIDLELIDIKEKLRNKINILDEINQRTEQMFHEINEELLQKITYLIQHAVRKIINKELSVDNQVMIGMIHNTLAEVADHQHIELLVSKETYEQFDEEDLAGLNTKISISPELNYGDYKIKTEIGEVIAILENRLTAFFG